MFPARGYIFMLRSHENGEGYMGIGLGISREVIVGGIGCDSNELVWVA